MTPRQYGNGRSETLAFRVTPEERHKLQREADAAGLGVSEYARARLLGASSAPATHVAAATYASLESIAPALTTLSNAVAQAQDVLRHHTTDPQ